MDSVELARQVAAELHARLVASGADPWSPYDFAVAEAKRRGIDVERTAAGAAVLNGGRATFVAADDLILHENMGSPFEQAFLVAHEIGHVELGDDPGGEAAPMIDPARPAEPSPVGMDRVVDYGRRQRREVQMDLFARELLLPRTVARALHVDQGLAASAIAAKLGAPFEVVAQQLFDALLLPPVPPAATAAHVERPLNPLQAAAAAHRGEAYLLEAGPGTGKTQTLIARVEGLLGEGVDPRRILLLTFSNKAAGEMAERIARKRPEAAAAMWIGTFHAFGLDIIRRFHAELGLPKDPRMMDRTEAVELLEGEFPRLRLAYYRNLYDPTQIIADMLAAVSRAKDEVVDAETYAALADAMQAKAQDSDAREAAERAGEVARVYAAYEQLKRNAHCIDFGDLVALPVQLLEKEAAICAALQAQYDHVLVDEYQDVNRSSVRLLSALRPDGRNLWMVGDAKQSIYRFRGASSFNITRFGKEDFAGGNRGRLKRNYRSVPEIVASFSSFAITMRAGDADSGLDADRDANGHRPELRTVQRAEQQQVALADAIEELRRDGYAYRDQAVLCTGNEKLSTIGQDLERLGVPVLFLGSLFERGEVKDLLALLSILVDRRAMGLVRIACWRDFATSFADVVAVFDHLRAAEHAPAGWLRHGEAIPGLSDRGRQTVAKLATALDGFDQTASPWTVLATLLLDRTRIAARLGASEDLADRTRGIAIWQFLNFVRVQPAGRGLPITRLLDRVRRLVRLGDDRDLRQLPAAAQHLDAVRLMTIHGAKGLEFGGVHIPGLNSDTIPRTPPAPPCPAPDGMIAGAEGSALEAFRAGQAEEQECLFYVAQSRARDRLILYAPTEKSNGHNRPGLLKNAGHAGLLLRFTPAERSVAMMGPACRGKREGASRRTIEAMLPADHLLRRVDRCLDIGELRQALAGHYSARGRPSIDPELLIRMALVGRIYAITSERRLCEELRYNLAYRWFCRLAPGDKVPHHSTFSKNRHGRFRDADVFRILFESTVRRCISEGLIGGKDAAIDASFIAADASWQRKTVPGYLPYVANASRAVREWVHDTGDAVFEMARSKSCQGVSRTDPAAAWSARTVRGRFGYALNALVDTPSGVALDVKATPARFAEEVDAGRVMLERSADRFDYRPKRVAADKAYGSANFLGFVRDHGAIPHIPVIDRTQQTKGKLPRTAFSYDRDIDSFTCPTGKPLRHHAFHLPTGVHRYAADARDCEACVLRKKCTTARRRTLVRLDDEDVRDLARAEVETGLYKRSMRLRRGVERFFADAKGKHGMRRLHLRGIRGAEEEFLIGAAVMNLMVLARPQRLTGKPRRGVCVPAALTPAAISARSIEHDVIASPARRYA